MTTSRSFMLASVLLLASLLILAFLIRSPFEITRLRNSLIAEKGVSGDFNWQPGSPPEDYDVEQLPAPSTFAQIVQKQQFDDSTISTLTRALSIARHMTGGDITRGMPIQSDTTEAYNGIVNDNRGYCSDYTQVFNALTHAAKIPVREWGMSFDGFSGDGHAFSEVYDQVLGKWVFLDSFNSMFAVDPVTKAPLSVLELQERLQNAKGERQIEIVPIDEGAFPFKSAQMAIDYYANGKDQFFLWFGSNVFTYDQHPVVEIASSGGRAVEQAAAILAGVHPTMRILPTEGSPPFESRLASIRQYFFISFGLGLGATLLLLRTWIKVRRLKRAKRLM